MPEHNLSDAEVDQIMERNRRSIRRLTIILAVIDNPALIILICMVLAALLYGFSH
jgi:predicted nucleic acid-binding Zn ribbon protein